jgi:hypothetical protein
MLAGVPGQGGASWAVLQYLLGLRRLGHDVLFVERVDSGGLPLERTRTGRYFVDVVRAFDLHGAAALLDSGGGRPLGVERDRIERFAHQADLLLNLSGALDDADLLAAIDVRAYVDLDPGFTQLWSEAEGVDLGLRLHNRFVTLGHGIGGGGSPIPSGGRAWLTTLQPIVLEHWPVDRSEPSPALTLVGHWRGYGSVEYRGTHYGQRAHSLRPLVGLPRRLPVPVVAALGIHPDETADVDLLRHNGWQLIDPGATVGTPARYRAFVRRSWAELGIAKSGYVAARCGWFSDRSVCFLASGRPVIAQDTGFGAHLPTGRGLMCFATAEGALAAVEDVRADYQGHRRAARETAEQFFDSDRVLTRLLACL